MTEGDSDSVRLLVVCGRPASGKTTFAVELARRERAAVIELDSVSEPIVQAGEYASCVFF